MQYTYCVMIQSLHLDIASDFDLFTFLSFRPWVYRLFSWAAQQQLQTRLQHRRKLLHSIWCLLSCSYRWTDPDLFIWMQKKISCTDIMSICHLFLHALGRIIMIFVCVCVYRRNVRLQHELRSSTARTQHPCGNADSCLYLVWQHSSHTNTNVM